MSSVFIQDSAGLQLTQDKLQDIQAVERRREKAKGIEEAKDEERKERPTVERLTAVEPRKAKVSHKGKHKQVRGIDPAAGICGHR